MSQSWDLALLSSSQKDYTADAVIRDLTVNNTYTVDAVVVAVQSWDLTLLTSVATTSTYTADAVVIDPVKTKTYTADGVIQDHVWYDITAPANLTYTVDAVVVSGTATTTTKTYTVDAIIKAVPTKTYTADAVVVTGFVPGPTKARIVRDTYTTSTQFGAKTVGSATFGDRTTYIHPESEIS